MPLTQAEMDFMTNHTYELHNFDRPCPAHEALRSLDPEHRIPSQKFETPRSTPPRDFLVATRFALES
jgi:hypothetical protein